MVAEHGQGSKDEWEIQFVEELLGIWRDPLDWLRGVVCLERLLSLMRDAMVKLRWELGRIDCRTRELVRSYPASEG